MTPNMERPEPASAEQEQTEGGQEQQPGRRSIEEIAQIGRARREAATQKAGGWLSAAGGRVAQLWKGAKQWVASRADLVAAAPELLAYGQQVVGEKMEAGANYVVDRVTEHKENINAMMENAGTAAGEFLTNYVENPINQGIENATQWASHKTEQVAEIGRQSVDMATAAATALRDKTVEKYQEGVDKVGETWGRVRTFGAEALAFAKQEMARIRAEAERRSDERRMEKLRARLGNDSAEVNRLASKHGLKEAFVALTTNAGETGQNNEAPLAAAA